MKNYYDKIFARNYDRFTLAGYYDYEKEAQDFERIVKGKDLLELGIGTGCLAAELLKHGYRIDGIEPSEAMIKELKKKNFPIKVFAQDASQFNTGKKYDAVFSHGAVPWTVLKEDQLFFNTYILNDKKFACAMRKSFEHLKKRGFFMCGVQPGTTDNAQIGGFYKNKTVFKGKILAKTHCFKEKGRWVSQTVTSRVWPEAEFAQLMEGIGFRTIGLNQSKTWYVFER